MKNFYLAFVFIVSISTSSHAQFHDFDSLVNANKEFKKIAKVIGDTLDIFNNNYPMRVTIESDFKNLLKRKFKDEYQDALFKTLFNDSVQVVRNIQIKPRGNMRKNTCLIPPLKLNFPKKSAYIKQIKHFDKLKMVLDCKRGDIYEQYLLSEYYVYELYNLLNPYSLRSRLLYVTYIDTSEKFKNVTKYAFIIESIDQLAERTNSVRLESTNVRDIRTNLSVLSDVYLFQYLIGNTDWSISGNHNMYYLSSKDSTVFAPFVVPYDFDFAGIVNTNYAIPNEIIGTESVRERVYRGLCLPGSDLENARNKLIEKKEAIYNLYQADSLLSKGNKKSTINYLDDFFKTMENENLYKRNILDNCR